MSQWLERRRAELGRILGECRRLEGISRKECARRLIGRGMPSYRYSQHPAGSQPDIAWLTSRLAALEIAKLSTPWPFQVFPSAAHYLPETEFIDLMTLSLTAVLEAEQRLLLAFALDTLRRADTLQPPSRHSSLDPEQETLPLDEPVPERPSDRSDGA